MPYLPPDTFSPTVADGTPAGHPSPERLAALADEAPSEMERAHLTGCLPCRRELDACRELLEGARLERDRMGPPLTSWDSLGAALRAQGMVRQAEEGGAVDVGASGAPAGVAVLPLQRPAAQRPSMREHRRSARWAARAAAVLLLAGGGLVAGRVSAGAEPLPGLTPSALTLGGPAPEARTVAAILADSAPQPASTDEAMAILTRAERDYRLATAYLADETAPLGDEADRPELYQRRLAVMDEVAALTRTALTESPHDPVLNQYYLASLGAREATLRQLATALPMGAQLSRF